MLRFGTVVRTLGFVLGCSMFAIVFAVLPGCDEFGEPDPPPTGTYRFVTLDRQYGQPIAVSPSGLVAWFRIDYRGPKSWLEIVIENRIDDALVGTEVLLRRQFGIDDFVKSDDASWSVVREPFTKTSQVSSLTLVDLPEVLGDGRTTLATVALSSPDREDAAKNIAKLIRVEAAYRAAELNGRTTSSSEWNPHWDGEYADSEVRELWGRSQLVDVTDDATGATVTRTHSSKIFLRFVAD